VAQEGGGAVDSVAVAAISTETRTNGTAYVTEVHDAAVGDGGEMLPMRASAVHNGQVGYTAFALWMMTTMEAPPDDAPRITTDGETWRIRSRNVSVRDTAVVVVVNRARFARIARAESARIDVGGRSVEIPAALRRQMRAIESTCTREPMGCE
jgi:hypothetical protein